MADFDIIARGMAAQAASSMEELTSQGEVTARVVLTQAEYDALATKVATTEYIIVEA